MRAGLEALLAGDALGEPGDRRIIETHISWVVLSGGFAWKIKKPLDLGFLDFSSLEARRHACEEELRLNRRLAPDIYLEVTGLRGSPAPGNGHGGGGIIDYAVKMRRFPDDAAVGAPLATRMSLAQAARLGEAIGRFHVGLPRQPPRSAWGGFDTTRATIEANLQQLEELSGAGPRELLHRCRQFLDGELARLHEFIEARRRAGAVRECHGDLHLGNLVQLGGRIVPFDALEFDPALRWTDVMSEVAFLVMDLEVRGRRDLAFGFLNAWLEHSGDFAGLDGLRLYLSHRALVRAKVSLLGPLHATAGDPGLHALLAYAAAPLPAASGMLLILSGPSGSGKSWLARQLAPCLPAIHIRSDVERKRLFGLAALARTASAPGAGIYDEGTSARVYEEMARLACTVLAAGLPVIVDATCLYRSQRAVFIEMAARLGRPALLLACTADEDTLLARVQQRTQEARDPSEADAAILREQLRRHEPPGADEGCERIIIDTGQPIDPGALARKLAAHMRDTQRAGSSTSAAMPPL